MKRLVVAALLAWSGAAQADVPPGIAQRLARFVFDGCAYFAANSPDPPKPEPPDKKLAAHFGRIVRTRKRGSALEYVVKTRAFEDWQTAYWFRGVDLQPPPTVAITIGDLQRFFGPDDSLDVDYAMSSTSTAANSDVEDREFDLKRDDGCRVTVRAEADKKKGAERRVFSLRFAL